ncbi:MAG: HAMP domain-containing sensor histidine kinase [Verrucomicrobia bacterium]|nr:HAMP domain-containing sensor histidine kinase [Verrucomicrobiota bacterium]
MSVPSSQPDSSPRPEASLSRRLSRHFIGLSVIFGVAAALIIFVAFEFFRPLMTRVNQDWTGRERAAIRSVGGLDAAVLTARMLNLFDRAAEQQVMMWAELRKRPELAYARIFNNVNGEIATVYRDGLTFQELPEPQKLEWDRSVYPPRLLDQMAYEMVQPEIGARQTFYERRLLLYRESFGRIFPIGVLTVAFNKMPRSIEEADLIVESCIGRQIVPGAKIAEGWPSGRVLTDSSSLVRYSYEMRDMVLYLAEVKKGTVNLLSITVFNQNGLPFLSELQTSPAFQFTHGLKGDPSLVRMTAHVRQRELFAGGKVVETSAPQAYEVFTPVFHHGALRGMVAFGLLGQAPLLNAFRETIQSVRFFMTLTTVALTTVMILGSVFMAVRLRRRIAQPLEQIAQAALDFVRGMPTDPAHHERAEKLATAKHYSRESRELSSAYSQMVGVIQQTLKEKDDAFATLESKDKQLFASQRQSLLGVVAAGVAHEIKNALNPVKLRAERMIMAHQMKRDVGLEEGLDLIILSVGRCAEISNKLSTFARPADVGSFFPFDLNDAIRDALAISNDVLSNAKVKVATQLGELPRLKGNPKEIQQAIMNFLLNGKDAIMEVCAKTGREGGNITISTASEGQVIILRITDDGCGMSDEVKKKVFVPFFTTKEPGKGTGLGMGISHSILQAHGAELRLESEFGKGTIITVRFPVSGPPLKSHATTTVFGRPIIS